MATSPHLNMRCACIDIGSNTTRVLVADVHAGQLREVLGQRAFTRIGRDLRQNGSISAAKTAEVAGVVTEQRHAAEQAGAETVYVVATAAIRNAINAGELIDAVAASSGLQVRVLDGVEEARLAFLGATRTLAGLPAGDVAVVDIGGGSTEIAVGSTTQGVRWARSFIVGSGALTDLCDPSDPPRPGELAEMAERVESALGPVGLPPVEAALAVGGSATSLRRLIGGRAGPAELDSGLAALCAVPARHAAERFDLDPTRVRLLPAGIVIMRAVVERLQRPLTIGCGGLREGVLLELAG